MGIHVTAILIESINSCTLRLIQMKYLDLTLSTPEQNLACDEALLDACEAGSSPELLRFWEPRQYFVVAGYSNPIASSVNVTACADQGIPILRRCSGGGTVLQGPGCLNYALILSTESSPALNTITAANVWIMNRQAQALTALLERTVSVQGTTDLTLGSRKFSGNSQRRRRQCFLFHGTLLLGIDLALVELVLAAPGHQPRYRENRSHQDFLVNLNLPADLLKKALRAHWQATEDLGDIPQAAVDRLVNEKYSQAEWNLKF